MSSAVEALLEGCTPAARHGKRSAYRAMCVCCSPEPDAKEGKPLRRNASRPTLAWRTRLTAQQTPLEAVAEATI